MTTLVLVATPGTGVVYTLDAGLRHGRRTAVLAAGACTLGIVPHLVCSITGLAALLRTSSLAYALLTWAGIAYLLHLAVLTWSDPGDRLVRAADPRRDATTPSTASTTAPTTARVLRDGVVLNLLNPKLTLFFVAFLPQFVPPGPGSARRMALLAAVFTAVTLVVFCAYGLAATALRPVLVRRPRLAGRANRVFAATYVLIAGALVLEQLPG
ncbi:LysE family translocator [Kineococcus gynurae]|uniref:LysE family translocator n=2 Tax=Kineococcus gynurae TaxID=452979 RepID=A0ABV5LRQ7_9ACTN